jgi:phosphatidylglycerophosphatase C
VTRSGPGTTDAADAASGTDVPTIAAFDFDGTLARGSSELPFLVRLRGALPVALAVLRVAPGLVRGALLSGASADRAKQALFMQLLAGVPEKEVRRVAADFAEEHLRRRLRPEVQDRLEWHRKLGHRVVIVSASPECYVRVAGELLGTDGALATRLQVGGGLLTGRYEGRNCRGAEKYARLVAWLRSEGLNRNGTVQPVLWAYGNSRGDLRLLHAADHGVDTGRLGRLGRLHRFPRLAAVIADTPPA